MGSIEIPHSFDALIPKRSRYDSLVKAIVSSVQTFISNSPVQQPFFPYYTDHSVDHINAVLRNAETVISATTCQLLEPLEVVYLISSILIHDIAMLIPPDVFYGLVEKGSNDDFILSESATDRDVHTWKKLYDTYVDEMKTCSEEKKIDIYGRRSNNIELPALSEDWEPTTIDCLTIGEFIRRYHDRYAHEVAILGFFDPEKNRRTPLFGDSSEINLLDLQVIGTIARSHNSGLDAFDKYLSRCCHEEWPISLLQIKYLMSVLRLADYMEIDSKRCALNPYRTIRSRISKREHEKHKSIESISLRIPEKQLEVKVRNVKNDDAEMVKELKKLINGFQKELNACHEKIEALNEEFLGERIYQLNFNEVCCAKIRYDDPDPETRKVRPYKYHSFFLSFYLNRAFEKYGIIHPDFRAALYPNPVMPINELFFPLTLVEIDKSLPTNKITLPSIGTDFEEMAVVKSGSDSVNEILRSNHKGSGIAAKAGYGKTTLSKALFCFFYHRLKGQTEMEAFWPELKQNTDLDFIPLMFVCRPNIEPTHLWTIESMFRELCHQVSITDSLIVQGIVNELSLIFQRGKIKLLIIIDAIDELVAGKVDKSLKIDTFLRFLSENIMVNEKHNIILTKRDEFITQSLKKGTKSYEILPLNKEEQLEIIAKLAALKGRSVEETADILNVFRNDEIISLNIKQSPLTLTNAFYYYDCFKEIPTEGKLEARMMDIFFERKGEYLSKEIRELLFTITLKIKEMNGQNTISENDLRNLITTYLHNERPDIAYTSSKELISVLVDKVGVLEREIERANGHATKYCFAHFKHVEHILALIDVDEFFQDAEENKWEKIASYIKQRVAENGKLMDEDYKRIANLLKRVAYE